MPTEPAGDAERATEMRQRHSPAAGGYCCEYCTPTELDSEGYRPLLALDIRRTNGQTFYRWMADVRIGKSGTRMHDRTLIGAVWAAGRIAWRLHRNWCSRLAEIRNV